MNYTSLNGNGNFSYDTNKGVMILTRYSDEDLDELKRNGTWIHHNLLLNCDYQINNGVLFLKGYKVEFLKLGDFFGDSLHELAGSETFEELKKVIHIDNGRFLVKTSVGFWPIWPSKIRHYVKSGCYMKHKLTFKRFKTSNFRIEESF